VLSASKNHLGISYQMTRYTEGRTRFHLIPPQERQVCYLNHFRAVTTAVCCSGNRRDSGPEPKDTSHR
jgi:hypothetical protein